MKIEEIIYKKHKDKESIKRKKVKITKENKYRLNIYDKNESK